MEDQHIVFIKSICRIVHVTNYITVESINDPLIKFDIINGGIIINSSHEIKPSNSNSLKCKICKRLYVECFNNRKDLKLLMYLNDMDIN